VSHQPQDVTLTLLKNGSMRTGVLHTRSTPFNTFVAAVEPEFAREMHAWPGYKGRDDEDEDVREKSQAAHFTTNKRLGKYHFGFGFFQNYSWNRRSLIQQFCDAGCSNRGFTEEEIVAYILEKNPLIQISKPDMYDGATTYTQGSFDRSKAGWDYHFGRTDVVVSKGPKAKLVD
jgi:hypothetical protein